MIKALVTGCLGKMGTSIINIMEKIDGIELCAAVELKGHPKKGEDIGELMGFGKLGILVSDDIDECIDLCDVIIDFTNPRASSYNIKAAARKNKAIVIGTTGFSKAEISNIRKIKKSVRCLMAPNMSVGINILNKILKDITQLLKDDYDIEIFEAHHRDKKDAPSGTAIRLAQVIAESIDRDLEKVGVFERHGIIGERTKDEIGIQTIRGGDIVGEHTVMFAGDGERIEITHKATSRDNFARGAVKAAIWICSQENGIYEMMDVLGIKS